MPCSSRRVCFLCRSVFASLGPQIRYGLTLVSQPKVEADSRPPPAKYLPPLKFGNAGKHEIKFTLL